LTRVAPPTLKITSHIHTDREIGGSAATDADDSSRALAQADAKAATEALERAINAEHEEMLRAALGQAAEPVVSELVAPELVVRGTKLLERLEDPFDPSWV
jgi:hypothetical protein